MTINLTVLDFWWRRRRMCAFRCDGTGHAL